MQNTFDLPSLCELFSSHPFFIKHTASPHSSLRPFHLLHSNHYLSFNLSITTLLHSISNHTFSLEKKNHKYSFSSTAPTPSASFSSSIHPGQLSVVSDPLHQPPSNPQSHQLPYHKPSFIHKPPPSPVQSFHVSPPSLFFFHIPFKLFFSLSNTSRS